MFLPSEESLKKHRACVHSIKEVAIRIECTFCSKTHCNNHVRFIANSVSLKSDNLEGLMLTQLALTLSVSPTSVGISNRVLDGRKISSKKFKEKIQKYLS